MCTSEKINKYRSYATNYVNNVTNYLVRDKVKKLEQFENKLKENEKELATQKKKQENIEKEQTNTRKDLDKRVKYCKAVQPRGFLSGVLQSVIASIIIIFISVLFVLYSKFPSDISQRVINGLSSKANETNSTPVNALHGNK